MTSPSKYNKLAGKRVLVFGGTTGMGYCVAEGCTEHGAIVMISGSNEDRIQKAIDRLRASYPSAKVSGYVCDLSDTPNLEVNLESLLKKATLAGKLDHIAFLAGDAVKPTAITDITVDDIPPVLAVRLYSAIILAKLHSKYMEVSPASSLTFTSGSLTKKPMPGMWLVSAVGGAIEALAQSLAVEIKPVRVNVVSPGLVQTENFASFLPKEALGSFLEAMAKKTAVEEVGKPEYVAEAFLYVMKDRYVTGENIGSNGGSWMV